MSYITFDQVCKDYGQGEQVVHAADHVSFGIEQGELCVVLGPSGAGKTTILNLLGGMDTATSGEIRVGDKIVTAMRGKELTEYSLTALENVELAQQVCPRALNPREVLTQVGLGERMKNFPAQLSGGEQQRVSIARALCKNPALLLCDEPTGALDSKTGEQVLELLSRVSKTYHTTVVIITHNASIAPLGDRVIRHNPGRSKHGRHCTPGGPGYPHAQWHHCGKHRQPHPARVEDIAW